MADALLAALQSKLVAYESAGMADHAKRVKARMAELEKTPAPKPVTVTETTTTTTTRTAPKKTVKKATKAQARKKR